MDIGFREAENHLNDHGWEWIGHWRDPSEVASMPVCKHCGKHFDPVDPNTCFAWNEETVSGYGRHEALPDTEAR